MNKKNKVDLIFVIIISLINSMYLSIKESFADYAHETYNNIPLVCYEKVCPVLFGILFALIIIRLRDEKKIILLGIVINIIVMVLTWCFFKEVSQYSLCFFGVLLYLVVRRK